MEEVTLHLAVDTQMAGTKASLLLPACRERVVRGRQGELITELPGPHRRHLVSRGASLDTPAALRP